MSALGREALTGVWAISSKDDVREIARQVASLTKAITDDVRLKAETHFQAQLDDPRIQLVGSVAVIPVCGPIFNKGNLFSYFFGGAVISVMRAQLRKALADDDVKAILLRVDSPGGVTDGVTEFAAEILRARAIKPIVAIADTCMASAAYWLSASAQEIIASPSAFVGSIGVFYEHEVIAKALEIAGIDIELVASSEEKVETHETKPLSDDARAHQQEMVDAMAAMFTADVARGRGITPKAVAANYGKGRTFLAADAKAMGLVDRVATIDETVARLTGGAKRRGMAAEADASDVTILAERSAEADIDWARAVVSRTSRLVDSPTN